MNCLDCGLPLRSRARTRGLCEHPCYDRRYRAGTHIDAPSRYRTRADTLNDWAVLRRAGLSRAEAAARMGMSHSALNKALWRAARDAAR